MSRFMIILLILILSIYLSCSKHIEKLKLQDNGSSINPNVSFVEHSNYVKLKKRKNNEIIVNVNNKKLQRELEDIMSKMVTKIVDERLFNDSTTKKKKKKTSGGELPVVNNLELEKEESQSENDNTLVNVLSDKEIKGPITKDLIGGTETRIIRRGLGSSMRKVEEKFARILPKINQNNENYIDRKSRGKRANDINSWIRKDFDELYKKKFMMHALVVRDEEIPPCCSTAKEVTDNRYFMCSGAILTLRHVITTASCMHFADIYEHHIDANLGVLVGATNPRAYVIKVHRYEMHPEYNYDVDSKNHAINNLAIIYLECNIIAEDVVIPSLPKGINDDVGHLCCKESCDLITIIQEAQNRHIARIMKARHLPAPRHDEDEKISNREFPSRRLQVPPLIKKHSVPNKTFTLSRGIRSPSKLASAPTFFGNQPRDSVTKRNKKRKRTKSSETSEPEAPEQAKEENDPLDPKDHSNVSELLKSDTPVLRSLEEEGIKVDEQLAAVDWQVIEETMAKKFSTKNREAMEVFAKKVVNETMKRLETVITGDGSMPTSSGSNAEKENRLANSIGGKIFGKLMPSDGKNQSISNFVNVFTKVVASLIPPNNASSITVSSDLTIDKNHIDDPPPIYEHCPPLGAPVIINGILVGLVGYTCDDVQSWVEWKYVNIAKNMNWIRKKISEHYEPAQKCPNLRRSFSQDPSSPEIHEIEFDNNPWMENQSEFQERNVEWRRGEIPNEKRDVYPRNLDDVGFPITETSIRVLKDPWVVRNSRVAPLTPLDKRIFANSQNRAKLPIVGRIPIYNVESCYIKNDGTMDCGKTNPSNHR